MSEKECVNIGNKLSQCEYFKTNKILLSALTELIESRVGSALWDAKPSNIKVAPQGKLCVVDTESPNNDDPQTFFGLDENKVKSNQRVAKEKGQAFVNWVKTGEWKD